MLQDGDRIKPEHDPDRLFEVERRVSEDYVVIVALDADARVGPGAWVYEDERHPAGMEELGKHVGFTDDSALPPASGAWDDDAEGEASEEE